MIYDSISKLLSILFPPTCYGCGKQDSSICPRCLSHCKKSLDTPALYITSLYSFRDPLIKKAIHAIKYFHRKDLIKPLATALANELKKTNDQLLITNDCILIPIPMTKMRKYMRGYNQAEIIAKELSKKCLIPYDTTILIRKKSTKRQVASKTKSERLKNQHKSFETVRNIKDFNIILVDDVTTTGATLCEARETLLKAGAKSVKAITLAH